MDNHISSADWRKKINDFLRKPAYIMLLMLLVAVSFVLEAELVTYTVFAILVTYICLCAEDLLPMMPILACAYVVPSTANNPGQSTDSVFSGSSGLYVVGVAVVLVLALIYRIIRDRKKLFRKNGTLLSGLIVLTVAYMLSGIGSKGYLDVAWKNIPYGLVQGLALLLPYWLFSGGVDWERSPKHYFAWIGVGMGCLLVAELTCVYISQGVISNGVIDRTLIFTGWGMYNNLGNLLAMMIPFAFWLGIYYKKLWAGYLVGFLFLAGVLLSCSRSAMIFATLCYCACCLWVPEGKQRKRNLLVFGSLAVVSAVLIVVFFDQIYDLFENILDDAHELGSRFDIYRQGLGEFKESPIFGSTFYPDEGNSYNWASTEITSLMPARWHNTVIQQLASVGLVGLLSYGFHRYQTFCMVKHRRSRLQVLMIFSALVLLLGSLTDTHFFNVGPGMFYAMLLVWLEKKEEPQ